MSGEEDRHFLKRLSSASKVHVSFLFRRLLFHRASLREIIGGFLWR